MLLWLIDNIKWILEDAETEFRKRNYHMKGTTLLLQRLFKLPRGTNHDSEYLNVNDKRVHIFNSFALVNYLLCSAIKINSMRDASTSSMKNNCKEHFRKALEILEPTIAIVQAKTYQDDIAISMDHLEPLDDKGVVFTAKLGKNVFNLLLFSHPSSTKSKTKSGESINSRWISENSSYFRNTIIPAINSL